MKRSIITIMMASLVIVEVAHGYASHEGLLAHYAPYIIQEMDCTEFGDYITSFDYDGDYLANNNWDNLGAGCGGEGCGDYPSGCVQARPLPAYVYSSVIETSMHFYLCYALFHPADDFHCHSFHHENDLEGMIMMVLKNGNTYGNLRMVQLQSHNDFYQYRAPGETGIAKDNEDIDGTIEMNGTHPVVYVEGGGHGIWADKSGAWWSFFEFDGPYIHYSYTGTAQNSTSSYHTDSNSPGGATAVGYDLLPITSEFWQRRQYATVFGAMGNYSGHRLYVSNLGVAFDGDTCMNSGAPKPPWYWDDWDDGYGAQAGDWFMDPAWVHEYYFNWSEGYVNQPYTFHPFLYNDLGGEIYGTLGKFADPPGPYTVQYDITIPKNSTVPYKGRLYVLSNVEVRFEAGRKVVADGQAEADGSTGTIRFVSSANPSTGIKLDGQIRLQNGGSIKFP